MEIVKWILESVWYNSRDLYIDIIDYIEFCKEKINDSTLKSSKDFYIDFIKKPYTSLPRKKIYYNLDNWDFYMENYTLTKVPFEYDIEKKIIWNIKKDFTIIF